jgi:hypothetical protein
MNGNSSVLTLNPVPTPRPVRKRVEPDIPGARWLGFRSLVRLGLAPLGARAARRHRDLGTPERLERGLVVILPGIDGCTTVSDNISWGLAEGGVAAGIQIVDWRRSRPWNPMHLTGYEHNRRQARQIAARIERYQDRYPGRPVHLIGHSAGAGMTLFVLEALERGVASATLLAAAISRRFELESLLAKTRLGIWNHWSAWDLPTLGLGTIVFGTMDRRHAVSAGALGFRRNARRATSSPGPELHDVRHRWGMFRDWNFGGHFGCVNAAFIRRHIAPILTGNLTRRPERN